MAGLSIEILLVLGVVAAATIFAVISRLKSALAILGTMLLFSAFGLPVDWLGNPIQSWIMPFQLRRSEIFAALGAMMVVATVFHLPRVRAQRIAGQGVIVLVIGVYAGIAQILGAGDVTGGGQTIAFALLTILPLVLIVPAFYDTSDELLLMLRFVALAVAAWIGICAIQFTVRPWVLMPGGAGRFQGMLSNPQHASAFLSISMVICIFLALNDRYLRFRPLWIAITVASGLMLLWTGSRTGLGMAAIGATAVLYARAGRAILVLPIFGVLFGVGFEYITETFGANLGVRSFTARGDTRTYAWVGLWEQFLESPMFGTGSRLETRFSENSYLYGMATYGIFMGALMLVLILISAVTVFKVLAAKRWLDPVERRIADLFIGFNAMYFAGSLFEGYVVSRVSTSLMFMLIFCGIGRWIIVLAQQRQMQEDWIPQSENPDLTESQALLAAQSDTASDYGDFSDYGSDTASRN